MADSTTQTTTTRAVAYARVLGPRRTKDKTSGLPAFFTTGMFDIATETPQQAAARAIGQRWHKIEPNPADWAIVLDEDVIQYANRPRIPYDRVFILRYLPDEAACVSEGIDPTRIPVEHKDSWYLTKKWKTASNASGKTPKTDSTQGT